MLLKLYDRDHNPKQYLLNVTEPKIVSSLSMGEKTLTFSWKYDPKVEVENEFYIATETDEYVIKEKSKASKGYYNIVAQLNLEDIEGKEWRKFGDGNVITAQECGRLALVDTGWKCISELDDKQRNITLTNTNSYKIFQKISEAYICEIQWDTINKTVYLKEKMGKDNGAYFLRGLNIKEIDDVSESYDYFTKIIPVGADGLTIEAVNNGLNYLENYQYSSKNKTLIWEDTNYKNADMLKADAEYKLNELSKPKKSYKLKLLDLARCKPGYSVFSYAIGDTITLIDPEKNIKEEQRIIKITEYPDSPLKNEVELSNTVLSFEEMQKKLLAAAENIQNVTNGNILIGPKVEGMDARQISGLEIYYTEPITNMEIEDILK